MNIVDERIFGDKALPQRLMSSACLNGFDGRVPHGGPGRHAFFYTMLLYDLAFIYRRLGYACMLSWVQLTIILLLTGLAFRFGRR